MSDVLLEAVSAIPLFLHSLALVRFPFWRRLPFQRYVYALLPVLSHLSPSVEIPLAQDRNIFHESLVQLNKNIFHESPVKLK